MRRIVYALASLFAIVLLLLATLLIWSPFENRLACQFQMALHDWTGLPILHSWPVYADEQYTGIVRIWDKWGTLREEYGYKNGARHGLWRKYAHDGTLSSVCEYEFGRPWNGVCQIIEDKAWIAEYKEGQPYNGCVWENDTNDNSIDYCFIDGRQVSVNEFMARYKIEEEARDWLSLRDIFTESQWKMQAAPIPSMETPSDP